MTKRTIAPSTSKATTKWLRDSTLRHVIMIVVRFCVAPVDSVHRKYINMRLWHATEQSSDAYRTIWSVWSSPSSSGWSWWPFRGLSWPRRWPILIRSSTIMPDIIGSVSIWFFVEFIEFENEPDVWFFDFMIYC